MPLCHRLSKDDERLPEESEPFIVLGSMYLMPKHLQLNNFQTGAQDCRQSYSQPCFAYRAGAPSRQ